MINIPIVVVMILTVGIFFVQTDYLLVLLFILSSSFSFIITFLLLMTINLSSFWFYEIGGIKHGIYFIIYLLSGSLIPIQFMPDTLRTVLQYLPFASLYNIPINIYFGRVDDMGIFAMMITQIFWLAMFYGIVRFMWNRGVRKLEVVGG